VLTHLLLGPKRQHIVHGRNVPQLAQDNADAEMVSTVPREQTCEDIICRLLSHNMRSPQLREPAAPETRGGDCVSHHGADPRIRYADSTFNYPSRYCAAFSDKDVCCSNISAVGLVAARADWDTILAWQPFVAACTDRSYT
jgi:hypothetical protein